MKKFKKGNFSLVELMVVIVIIGMLSGIAGIAVLKKIDSAKIETARAELRLFSNEITTFKMHTSRYPADLKDLITKPEGLKGWKGPYINKQTLPDDPWLNPYVYQLNSGDKENPYKVFSTGDDGQEGTADDVYIDESEAEGAIGSGADDSGGLGSITPE